MPRSCWSIQNKLGGIFVGVWHHFALQIFKTFFFFGLVSLLLVYSGFHFLVFLCVLFCRERERSWVGGEKGKNWEKLREGKAWSEYTVWIFFQWKKSGGEENPPHPSRNGCHQECGQGWHRRKKPSLLVRMPNNPATVEAISKRNYHGISLSASRVQTHRGLHGHFRDTCTPM